VEVATLEKKAPRAVVPNRLPDRLIARKQELVTWTTNRGLAAIAMSEGVRLLLQVASSEAVVGGIKVED